MVNGGCKAVFFQSEALVVSNLSPQLQQRKDNEKKKEVSDCSGDDDGRSLSESLRGKDNCCSSSRCCRLRSGRRHQNLCGNGLSRHRLSERINDRRSGAGTLG